MALEKTDLPNQYIRRKMKGGHEPAMVVCNGLIGTLQEWAEHCGRSRSNLTQRLNKMSVADACQKMAIIQKQGPYTPTSFYKMDTRKSRKPRLMPSGIPEVTSLL